MCRLPRQPSQSTLPLDKQIQDSIARILMKLQEEVLSSVPDTVVSVAETERQVCVLLAEDDRALRRFLEVVLKRAGYRVLPACDGLEAMKLALSTSIDVVVTDAMMPNLSGHEFCRFLRNSQTLSQVPIILLSALDRKDTNQTAEQADAFLSKPVTAESLVDCIERVINQKSR